MGLEPLEEDRIVKVTKGAHVSREPLLLGSGHVRGWEDQVVERRWVGGEVGVKQREVIVGD